MPRTDAAHGLIYAGIAFGIWGIAPIYFRFLLHVPAPELLAHRVIWSMLALSLLLVLFRRVAALRNVLRDRRLVGRLILSGVLVTGNWGLFLWAVLEGHVLQSSLGYYINPLLNVALGALVLKESLNGRRKLAVAIAALGVVALVIAGGEFPWIALCLATSFALYGLVRKMTPVDPLTGLLFETTLATPVALAYLWYLNGQPVAPVSFTDQTTFLLLLGTAVVTTIPLLAFNAAAKRLDFATLGICQYLSPSLQFILAVTLFGEKFTLGHALAFGAIWTSLAIYTGDLIRAARTVKS